MPDSSAPLVQKFGGSSLATVDRIHRVADRVASTHRAGRRLAVVASAMGGRTDELLHLARATSARPHARELDALLSTGEAVSTSLLAMALRDRGIDAVSLRAWQAGIFTRGAHGHARIEDIDTAAIAGHLSAGRVAIVAGYQGVGDQAITTLGRGGSDYTAVALAHVLRAERCEIYSDVEGVYSADPRLVPTARPIDALAYDEMLSFARQGARVLNVDAMKEAATRRVVVYAGASFGGSRFTVVGPRRRQGGVVGVTGRPEVFRVHAEPETLDALCRDHHVIGRTGAGALLKLHEGASAKRLASADVAGPFATVAIVGEGVASEHGKVMQILAGAAIEPRGETWSTECALTFVIAPERFDRAIRRVHDAFVVPRPRREERPRA